MNNSFNDTNIDFNLENGAEKSNHRAKQSWFIRGKFTPEDIVLRHQRHLTGNFRRNSISVSNKNVKRGQHSFVPALFQ